MCFHISNICCFLPKRIFNLFHENIWQRHIGADFSHIWLNLSNPNCRVQNPDIPRAGRLGADGWAGSGKTGCQQNCSPRGQETLVPSKAWKTRRLNVSPEARTSEILCNPNAGTKNRLTTGSSAVHPRIITGTASALSSWLLTSGPMPLCSWKTCSCRDFPAIVNIVECKTQTNHGQVESGRTAARRNRAGQDDTPTEQHARIQPPLVLPKASKTSLLNDSPEARTSKIAFKPNAGTKLPVDNRSVIVFSAVYFRDKKRSSFLAADQRTDTFFCFFKPFSCKACPGTIESKTRPYHGQVESGRTAGRRGRVGQDWKPTELWAQEKSVFLYFQSIGNMTLERFSTCRIQNTDTLRAGRVGAAHGGAARGGGAG